MMKIAHVAIWTKDLERLRAYYQRYFGAMANEKYINAKKGFESYFLTFDGGAKLELMSRTDIDVRATDRDGEVLGYAHLALSIGSKDNVDALCQRLAADGVKILDGPRTTGDGYYECLIVDPDGNRLEITV